MTDMFLGGERRNKRNILLPLAIILLVLGVSAYVLLKDYKWSKQTTETKPDASVTPQSVDTTPAMAPSTPSATTPTPSISSNTVPDNEQGLLVEAKSLIDHDNLLAAREKCYEILAAIKDPATRAATEAILGDINMTLVMSQRPMPEKVDYIVQSGDSLNLISKKFGTTKELIVRGNNIRNNVVRLNDHFLVLTGRFDVCVSKTTNDLVLNLNHRFFKRYRVGTGQYSKTPTGSFLVVERVAQPVWWRNDGKCVPYGDPENLLGTHWLSLNVRGYGIHGTWDDSSVGKQSSAGCIRLINKEVEELYTLLPAGTPVEIHE